MHVQATRETTQWKQISRGLINYICRALCVYHACHIKNQSQLEAVQEGWLTVNDVGKRGCNSGVNEKSIRTIGTRIQSILRINFFSSMGDRGGYLVVVCAMYIAA